MLTQHKTQVKYLSVNFLMLFTGLLLLFSDTLPLFVPSPRQALLLDDKTF